MKKLTSIFAALVQLFITTASASDPGENKLNSVFKMAGAKAVHAADVTKENSFTVACNNEGEMIAISRIINLHQLPLAVAGA